MEISVQLIFANLDENTDLLKYIVLFSMIVVF